MIKGHFIEHMLSSSVTLICVWEIFKLKLKTNKL